MCAVPRSTRREFLQGKAAADALIQATGDAASEAGPAPLASDGYLLQLARRAMACKFEFFFNAGQYPQATETAIAAFDRVDRLEDQLSVFLEHSEVSRLNRDAALEPLAVDAGLFALLQLAVEIFHETGGAYDVTAGPLSSAWGFTRRAGTMPSAAALDAARSRVGSQFLKLDCGTASVQFLKEGLELNLGSIGKGYALDRCAELLAAEGIGDFLLHGGNSSVLARGVHAALAPDGGWSVGVRDPLRPDRRLGQLRLHDRALATSGSGTQFFVHEGRRYGHLLDPRTGWPAEGVLSASVLAPTAARADALSTAFYVLGPALAREYCEAHQDVAAVIVCPGKREGSLEAHLIGLDEQQWSETAKRS